MNRPLKALAALLTYPDAVLVAAGPELRQTLADVAPVVPLLDRLASTDPFELQEDYVALFDTGRSLSLHLFEHVHGESKDRGQAMVDLRAHYEAAGLTLVPEELPDYLPAFLEFCSVIDPAEAADFFAQVAPILDVLGRRLNDRKSPYAGVFEALRVWAGPGASTLPPPRPEADLDHEWAEEPAFSSPQGAC